MTTTKKLLSASKVIAILCWMINLLSAAQFGNFTYTDNGTSITITDYPETAVGPVVIPASILGKPVTAIGINAFQNCQYLKEVSIPVSITSVRDGAFRYCNSLTSISIPVGLTYIGQGAFAYCPALTSATIPASVTSMGSGVFYSCTTLTAITVDPLNAMYASLDGILFNKSVTLLMTSPAGKTGSFTIPGSVTAIGLGGFANCSLTGVTIPDSVVEIGDNAFYSCRKLSSIVIPASVASIGQTAFYDCTELTSISVDSVNPVYSSIDGVLYPKNLDSVITCPAGKAGGVAIPAGVATIGDSAFARCGRLTSVMIPSSVTIIRGGAFMGCSSLTNITIPDSVSIIGSFAFSSCTSLADVVIPSAVKVIERLAFSSCTSMTSVSIPDSVISIGQSAFQSCTSLTSVTIPESVTSIEGYAFWACSSLTSAYFLGVAPFMGDNVFGATSSEFTAYFFNDKVGFATPVWMGHLAVGMGNALPAKKWLILQGLPYDSDLNTDVNTDGVNLLMAYALNLDPRQNLSGSMPTPVIAGNQLSLTFYAGSPGVSYIVESCTDLHSWSTAGVNLSVPDANGFRTATVAATDPGRFMRLVAIY